ncbi:histidine kinase [Roseivirga ehrenbergii]|uniref:Signal transduction histidine kinase internal region domain-containing protein n=1 Tax=Roseivirga ehrenbergii (strain DSM 102268 / JCM 13514 / KCTC 12282 / NCIMB 14502 / KMM 6017) TaxID=279360 RepID=A0A150X836_ROSEK|nr:histidine kinase [Roseivirga ehrenbergii]KYG74846.1 hypothetical protein MB14_06485 [Roseivirga ehrenbergii]TCL13818.1 histidine kinase [Roseivirga ehrenbergii]
MFPLSLKTIRKIKVIFNVILISIVILQLIRSAYFLIPDDWLFFWTSDALENLLFASSAYVLYYYSLKFRSLLKKIGLASALIIPLVLLAALKNYRIYDELSFEQTFEFFTSFLGHALLYYLLIYFVNRLELFSRYKQLEDELNQAKAQLLRNQLHPHFLFNAFNSLYSLSLKNHPDTSEYILKLSSMMRYLTDETHLNKVPLSKELDFIQKYIAIEKIRFGNDARINLSINKAADNEKWIEPFLLIVLVENAFKHGFYTNAKGAFVNITVTIEQDELLFTVENSVFEQQHFQESNRQGKGLENLKQRLALLYPNSSGLKTTHTEDAYTTKLKLTLA